MTPGIARPATTIHGHGGATGRYVFDAAPSKKKRFFAGCLNRVVPKHWSRSLKIA